MQAAAAKVVAQEYFLIETVCKNGNFEVGGCTVGVTLWWAQIADIIFNSQGHVNGICHHVSDHVCPEWEAKSKRALIYAEPKAWDCETCKTRLPQVAEGAHCEENMPKVIKLLQGLKFLVILEFRTNIR